MFHTCSRIRTRGTSGTRPPTSCRAGDDSYGHLHPSAPNTERVFIGMSSFYFHDNGYSFCIQGCGGGSSVRRRNALHEVGGRVPEVPRVRNARAGSETHTHINIFTFSFLTNNILFLSNDFHKLNKNKFIKKSSKKVLKYSEF